MSSPYPDSTLISEPEQATQAPDLAAATGQPGGGGSNLSLMGMLGGMGGGGIPNEAILGLMQPPSQGMTYAAALSGGVSAMRGQKDPVQAIMHDQQQQQVGIMGILQKMQARDDLANYRQGQLFLGQEKLRDARAQLSEKKLDARIKFAQDTMNNANVNPAGLAWAQQDLAKAASERFGMQMPPTFVERVLTTDQKNALVKDIYRHAQQDPQTGQYMLSPEGLMAVAKAHPTVPQAEIPGWLPTLSKPGVLESFGLKTTNDLKKDAANTILAEGQAIEQMMPAGFQRTAPNSAIMHAKAQELYPDVPILKLTPDQRKEITERVAIEARQVKADDIEQRMEQKFKYGLDMLAAKGEMQTANTLALADQKAKMKSEQPANWNQVTRSLEPFVGLSNGVKQIQMIRRALAEMPDAAFPSGTDFVSRWAAKQYREKMLGGDQPVFDLQVQVKNVMNGVVGRKYFDDKGNRVWASQASEMENIDNLPSRKVFDSHLKMLQDEMRRNMTTRYDTLEATGITPEPLLKGARQAIGQIDPKARQAQPPSPLNPPSLRRQFMDMRPGSANYGKAVWATFDVGDQIPPGYVEVK